MGGVTVQFGAWVLGPIFFFSLVIEGKLFGTALDFAGVANSDWMRLLTLTATQTPDLEPSVRSRQRGHWSSCERKNGLTNVSDKREAVR